MASSSTTAKPSTTEAERARLRKNQRNSRARKAAYVEDLERRWAQCVKLGAQATADMQQEARRIHTENRVLRELLAEAGVASDVVDERILVALKEDVPLKMCTAYVCTPGHVCTTPTQEPPIQGPASRSQTTRQRPTLSNQQPPRPQIETIQIQQTPTWRTSPSARAHSTSHSHTYSHHSTTSSLHNLNQQEWDVNQWLAQLTKIKDDYRPQEIPTIQNFGAEDFDFRAHGPEEEVQALSFGGVALGTFSMVPVADGD